MAIIDGKLVAKTIREDLKNKISEAYDLFGKKFKLSVVIAGEDPASEIYVRNKSKACEEAGIISETIKLNANVSQEELELTVKNLVKDESVDGILVQLPLPKGLDEKRVLKLIPPEKDVDGFSDNNIGRLTMFSEDALYACTPHGIMKLLEYYNVPLCGKHAVVVGRSNIVGKPMAILLLRENATVTICHSHTKDLKEVCKRADILVAAIGKPKFFNRDYIKEGAVVIDVGIHRNEQNKLCGDVDRDDVMDLVSAITPVPGGVGPMTIAMLMYNCVEAVRLQKTER